MRAAAVRAEAPALFAEVAELMRATTDEGRTLRARGGGTKLSWGAPAPDSDLEIATRGLSRIVEHNAGDLTAIVEAGARLADVQAAFGEAAQILALDPPLGESEAATIGGIVATADAGPLQHRYGGIRDLLLGITVALADGTIATSGGKVIKNVAGYDLAKLFAGSYGTLGVILQVVVRLHPRPRAAATLLSGSDDPAILAAAASRLAHAPLELESFDVSWENGRGSVLARFAGVSSETQATAFAPSLAELGVETEVRAGDDELWAAQRERQRSRDGVVVRVSGLPALLERVLRATDRLGGSLVGRAGLGVSWVTLGSGDVDDLVAATDELRRGLDPSPCVVLDAPAEVRERIEVWDVRDEALLRLMRRVKERFDPGGTCAPGLYGDRL